MAGAKPIRRKKQCPGCNKEEFMLVIRSLQGEDDLWWVRCSSCGSEFALTRQQYQRQKQPKAHAVEKDTAKPYHTDQTYSVGELIYHHKLADIGFVVRKMASPLAEYSGTIIVSFMNTGQKKLVEGYSP